MGVKRQGKLLLVEDEALLRGLVCQFLGGEGFEVVEAADGAIAVDRYLAAGPFDVVLVDLNLPKLSGVEVCRRIKAHEPDQPVMICSAAILESHVVALGALGINQFLSKPYHPMELIARIKIQIDRGAARRLEMAHASVAPSRPLFKSPIFD